MSNELTERYYRTVATASYATLSDVLLLNFLLSFSTSAEATAVPRNCDRGGAASHSGVHCRHKAS